MKNFVLHSMQTGGSVYILASLNNKLLYIGVTSDLYERVEKHKTRFHPDSYSAKRAITKLVYYENFDTIVDAIKREKQLKKFRHLKKVQLIVSMNPAWEDLHGRARY